jgi:hypothetical protein
MIVESSLVPMPANLNNGSLSNSNAPASPASKQRPRRNFFPKPRQTTSKSDSKAVAA